MLMSSPKQVIYESFPPEPENKGILDFRIPKNSFSDNTSKIPISLKSEGKTVDLEISQITKADTSIDLSEPNNDYKINQIANSNDDWELILVDVTSKGQRHIKTLTTKYDKNKKIGFSTILKVEKTDKVFLLSSIQHPIMYSLVENIDKGKGVLRSYTVQAKENERELKVNKLDLQLGEVAERRVEIIENTLVIQKDKSSFYLLNLEQKELKVQVEVTQDQFKDSKNESNANEICLSSFFKVEDNLNSGIYALSNCDGEYRLLKTVLATKEDKEAQIKFIEESQKIQKISSTCPECKNIQCEVSQEDTEVKTSRLQCIDTKLNRIFTQKEHHEFSEIQLPKELSNLEGLQMSILHRELIYHPYIVFEVPNWQGIYTISGDREEIVFENSYILPDYFAALNLRKTSGFEKRGHLELFENKIVSINYNQKELYISVGGIKDAPQSYPATITTKIVG